MASTNDTGTKRPVIGILGGMGPLATAEFFGKVVRACHATGDHGHPRVVVECDPSIPDRTEALSGGGADPLAAMTLAGRRLADAGVEVGALVSMTAHAWLDELRVSLPFSLLSAFEVLGEVIKERYAGAARIGVLATTGLIRAGLFDKQLPGLRVHYSDDEAQSRFVMEAIYGPRGIKAGNLGEEPRHLLRQAAARLVARGSDLVIVACAEMPLVLTQADVEVPLLDPTRYLAEALAAFRK